MVLGRVIKRTGEAIIQIAEEPVVLRRLAVIRRQLENPVQFKALMANAVELQCVLADLWEFTK